MATSELVRGDILRVRFRGEPTYAVVLDPDLNHGTGMLARVQLMGSGRISLVHCEAIEANLGPVQPPVQGTWLPYFKGVGGRVIEVGPRESVVEVVTPGKARNLNYTRRLTIPNYELTTGWSHE